MSNMNRMESEMMRSMKKVGLPIAAIIAMGSIPSFAASAASTHVLSGHIPRAVSRMTDLGKMDGQQMISVSVALHLNNESELDSRIAQIYTVGSEYYHQFLTPATFKARYSPTDAQVANEKAFLASKGLTVQDVSDNNVLVHAQGTVAQMNEAFGTEIHQFQTKSGEVRFAPANDVSVPVGSQIAAVIGLNNVTHFHNHLVKNQGVTGKDGGAPEGTAPGGGLAPADITTAYGIPSTVNGSGQTLALFELDGYDPTDIAAYEKQFNLPNIPLKNVLLDGFDGSAGQGAIEVVLDIEMMVGVAPQASKIVVYEGPNSSQGLIDTYAKIASDNTAQQISSSWGEAETQAAASDMQSENTIFKQMVAQGQTLYSASGDSGADDDGSSLSVDDPSGQPNVIAVGGTTMTLASDGSIQSEVVWNELAQQEGACGGGISKVWTIPTWQVNAVGGDKQSSKTMRNVPDVTLNADPVTGYGIYQGGQWQVVGGTSAAAPLWAAFTALVNQQRATSHLTALGFAAPAIYAIGEGKAYATGFNDITSGTNGTGTDSYSAVKGFDNASGWGSFKGAGLLQQLSADATSNVNSCSL
jgi:kumamolisin